MPKKADFSVASALPDDFVDRFAVVGDPQECADRFREVMNLGVDRILVLTRVPTTDREEGNAARLADTVLSQLS
jgi:5,10-methylenetetrahydromethanopterin reductase